VKKFLKKFDMFFCQKLWHVSCSRHLEDSLNNPIREANMKKLAIMFAILAGLSQWGCQFLGGAAVGGLATGAGYELRAKQQMDQLEEDYKKEKISRKEYESRKKQIEAGSIIY
jgi:hypothetical protein